MLSIYYSLKGFFSKHWIALSLVLLVLSFFCATASYNYLAHSPDFIKWSSPDESANYFLTKQYAEKGELSYSEPANLYAQGIIMPRSFRTDGDLVKPVSFLGLIFIYGNLAKLFGTAAIPYFTPAFAALGLVFFYLIVERLFKREVAIVSTFLLAAFPVYIYFSARSMFHNILFVVLWLIGLYFSLRLTDTPALLPREASPLEQRQHYLSWLAASLAGLFTGLAVTVRSSELLWLLPLLLMLWLFNFYRLGLARLVLFVYFFCLAFVPIMSWNMLLYNSPLHTGYPQMNQSLAQISSSTTQLVKASATVNQQEVRDSASLLRRTVFFFGFKPAHSEKMFYHYIYKMFTWLVLAAGLGFLFLIFKTNASRKSDLLYLLGLGGLSAVLIFYYGSWVFYDNPDPNSYTIGNSYTRYWLPIYFGLIPLAALALVRLSSWLKLPVLVWLTRVIVIAIIMLSSASFVLYGSNEGLVFNLDRQISSKTEWQKVLALTPSDAVIITRYHDKLLFPERKVIMGLLTDDNMNRLYANLVKQQVPLYYYNFTLADKDFDYLNSSRLKVLGLKIDKVAKITKDFTLYRLSRDK